MAFCGMCGKQLGEGSAYCHACGARAVEEETGHAPDAPAILPPPSRLVNAPAASQVASRRPANRSRRLLIWGIAFVVLIAVVLGGYFGVRAAVISSWHADNSAAVLVEAMTKMVGSRGYEFDIQVGYADYEYGDSQNLEATGYYKAGTRLRDDLLYFELVSHDEDGDADRLYGGYANGVAGLMENGSGSSLDLSAVVAHLVDRINTSGYLSTNLEVDKIFNEGVDLSYLVNSARALNPSTLSSLFDVDVSGMPTSAATDESIRLLATFLMKYLDIDGNIDTFFSDVAVEVDKATGYTVHTLRLDWLKMYKCFGEYVIDNYKQYSSLKQLVSWSMDKYAEDRGRPYTDRQIYDDLYDEVASLSRMLPVVEIRFSVDGNHQLKSMHVNTNGGQVAFTVSLQLKDIGRAQGNGQEIVDLLDAIKANSGSQYDATQEALDAIDDIWDERQETTTTTAVPYTTTTALPYYEPGE